MRFAEQRRQELKQLLAKLDRVRLIECPTPLHEAPRLSRALGGPRILFKREDLTGLAFGGNKSRMFEFVLGHALSEGCDTVIAGAAVQSNYCRLMTAACAKLGLDIHLILRAITKQDRNLQGNLLLALLAGAQVTILENGSQSEQKQAAEALAAKLKKEGRRPFIARAMSEEHLGYDALAYAGCMIELCEQLREMNLQAGYLYFASGDTTHTGLLFAAEYLRTGLELRGANPSGRDFLDQVPEKQIKKIEKMICEILRLDFAVDPAKIHSSSEYLGRGYGRLTDQCREAIKLVAEKEGIYLDPIYTGKAMAMLIDHIRQGKLTKDDTVVFMHTGGTPLLFAYADELGAGLAVTTGG